MCLGVPGKVIEVAGNVAIVDFWGVRRQVQLDVVDEPVAPGDYILNHVGFAIRRIPESEIGETLALYEQLIAQAEQDDLMAEDVRNEIAASRDDPRAGN
ncbi:MAG: HypC/HybG/HupF family hydrogenase formation chaperone [Acidobacteria bacterium]|nr:HypC/HybG/HupF family hydrogenase formation chaperone [Acidobacteriota bacterium]